VVSRPADDGICDDGLVVATDVGGTCTDTIVMSPDGRIWIGKALSTPPDYAEGVLGSIASAAGPMGLSLESLLGRATLFLHGSTVADNTILTRAGSRTGLIATAGFEDTLLVTRGAYGRWAGLTEDGIKHPVMTERPPALVAADCIVGVPERVDCDGEVVLGLDPAAAEAAVRLLVEDRGVEAIAIALLWSVRNPVHEHALADVVRRLAPHVYVTASADIAPVPGEYERTSTAVINAYAGRLAHDYLGSLADQLRTRGYQGATMVMQGYGGLLPADEAADRAVGMIECGPAAGVIGARSLGDLMGDGDIIAADMGGTTFKVGVIQGGQVEYAREPMVDRFHYVAPKMEVVSIGAGGGSIVSLDPATGVPVVGPQSAGSRPGPVCYGTGGTEPTLTDVLLIVGYMAPDHFLRGEITLDADRAREVFEARIADPLGVPVETAAVGIVRIAAAQVTDLVRQITVERGLDPREFVLHAFGGSCGMLAGMFGQELGVRRLVIPYTAAVNCALGLISADVAHEYLTTRPVPAEASPDEVNALFKPMVATAIAQLEHEGFRGDDVALDWSVDLRYRRQVHEVTTPVRAPRPLDADGLARLVDDFEALYERRYGRGSAYREAGIEMTTFRLTARGLLKRPALPDEPEDAAGTVPDRLGQRDIFVEAVGGMARADVYDVEALRPGHELRGPAVIHTPITTIVVQAGQTARIDRLRNVLIEFARGGEPTWTR
jgi:N-methylhydantoinase A